MANNTRLQLLIGKYMEKSLSDAERTELRGYFEDPAFLLEIEERFGMEYEKESGADEMNENHQKQLLKHIFEYDVPGQVPQTRKVKLWPRIAIAASVAAIVISVGVWIYSGNQNNTNKGIAYNNDVTPGKQGATLTLANGEKIRLSDAVNGALAEEAGVIVIKSSDGQLTYKVLEQKNGADKINVLTTDNGETYQVRLPDGSSVWLNAASTLKYPVSFAKSRNRRVELSGEGYFEVAKDKRRSFIVMTADQKVEVLGTHFNIQGYTDEAAIRTTLLEGSVKVISVTGQNKVIKPGEQATVLAEEINVSNADVNDAIAWKNGDIQFDNKTIPDIMRQIARWYDVKVVYEGKIPKGEWNGSVSRTRNLSQVLKMMEKSKEVKFRINGKTVFVSE